MLVNLFLLFFGMFQGWILGHYFWPAWRRRRRMARLRKMKDSDIDFSDIPELDQAWFDRAQVRKPRK